MKPLIVVATFLGGNGPTGVETHFNQVLRDVAEIGAAEARLVTPYTGWRLRRALFRPFKNAKSERAALFYLRCQAAVLRQQLREIFARTGHRSVTVYAQCPASAEVALAARGNRVGRVVTVVHYNVSQSEENVTKGIARSDGPWCRELDRAERETLPRVDGIAFVSDFMRRIINDRIPAVREVFQETIFNFAPPPLSGAENTKPDRDLIAIGTLEARKNQAFLLQVLAAANALGHRYTLTMVGDGPDRPRLGKLARELNVTDQVRFAGFLRNASSLIPAHRILVHAAKRENSPLIVPEAFSYGRPVFAAPVGGIPEMVRDGVEGHLWNLDQPQAAAKFLNATLEDSARYRSMATAARARYDSAFAGLREKWIDFLAPQLRVKSETSTGLNPERLSLQK